MTNPYTKGYFEEAEGSHYHGYEDWPQFKDRAEWIKKEYNPKAVLDIGAAKGFLVKHLRDLGIKADGVDLSEYAASKSEMD
jgi:2-polyprenyl-3-methyl-5-hydroxy-6-metoxy-1,4-benzoquinol methylase